MYVGQNLRIKYMKNGFSSVFIEIFAPTINSASILLNSILRGSFKYSFLIYFFKKIPSFEVDAFLND